MRHVMALACATILCAGLGTAEAQPAQRNSNAGWFAAWTASAHGPYPVGNPTAQPELRFALPSADTGARDQTFRMIVRPDVWGDGARIRLSNAFGKKPVTFDGAYLGLQSSGATLVPGTNRALTFGGKAQVTVQPGQTVLSDRVALPWARANDPMMANRKLAVSFHVVGETGPLTWHAKALTTSYLSGPGTGSAGADGGEHRFPFSTTSWFFLDEVDMQAPGQAPGQGPGTRTVVTMGDSITDGTASTINGDDRWPDVFSRRVHAALGNRYSVVNHGIGGNMVSGPPDYAQKPFPGGPAMAERLERDIIAMPNVSTVIWLEGINDFGNGGYETQKVSDSVRDVVKRLRAGIPGVKVFMGTLTSSLNSNNGGYGAAGIDAKRKEYNEFIRKSGIFDGVIDFDAATLDPATGELRAEFQPNSSTGGPGDKLHPNRAGYAAMGEAIDLRTVFGTKQR